MRRYLLVFLVGILLGGVAVRYWGGHAPRGHSSADEDDPDLVLGRPLREVWLDAVPLGQALAKIGELAGTQIDAEPNSLKEAGVDWQKPITIHRRNALLGDVLDQALNASGALGLKVRIVPDHYGVSISAPPSAQPRWYVRIYNVRDLLAGAPGGTRPTPPPTQGELSNYLERALSSAIGSDDDFYDSANLDYFGDRLIVLGGWRDHNTIRKALDQLRNIPPYPPPAASAAPDVLNWNASLGQWVSTDADRANDALQQKLPSLRLSDVAFDGAIDALGKQAKVPLLFNRAALQKGGISIDAPVTVNLRDITVAQALDALLRSHPDGDRLDFAENGGMVVISTRTETEGLASVRVYDMRDWPDAPLNLRPFWSHTDELPRKAPSTDPRDQAFRDLTQAIRETIDPPTWRENGGKVGLIRNIHDELVIQQTYRNHERITAMLNAIRAANSRSLPTSRPSTAPAK